jgi:hypothetical protein
MNIYDDYEQNRKIIKLEEEIRTLKNKIEFLTICLDDRDKSIALTKKENRKLEEENKKLKESLDIATKCSSKEED